MKSKKILAILLAAMMTVGTLTACGNKEDEEGNNNQNSTSVNKEGFPIVDEPITLSIFGSQDQNQTNWQDMWFFKEYSKMTGINFDFQQVSAQGYEEKVNLLFVSGDLPDVFYRSMFSSSQILDYGVKSKQLMDLSPYLEEYAPNYSKLMKDNKALKMTSTASDGKIYSLYPLDVSSTGIMDFKQFINENWLKAVGKEVPTTPEEFKDVLIAFRDKDPNGNGEKDEIPLGIREVSSVYSVLAGTWGLEHQLNDTVNIEDGKVHIWLKDEAFKEYLMFLNELYEEGLMWQNYYKADSRSEWRTNLSTGLFGTFYMPYSDVFLSIEDQYIGYDPLKGPNGDQIWAPAATGVTPLGAFALSSTCKNPEAAIRWVDYLYTEEGSLLSSYGKEGETFNYDEKGNPVLIDEIVNSPDGFMTELGKYNLIPGGASARIITEKTSGIVASERVKQISNDLVPFLPKEVYPAPSFTEEQQEKYNIITQDLYKYRDEVVTKLIIGEWDFDQWDTYCETLDKIGLKDLEKIYQEAFDAMNK